MITARGLAVENDTAFSVALAWRGAQGAVAILGPHTTLPLQRGPSVAGLFEGEVVGVLGSGSAHGLHVSPTQAWVAPSGPQEVKNPKDQATLRASGLWSFHVPPGQSAVVLQSGGDGDGDGGDTSMPMPMPAIQLQRTPTRVLLSAATAPAGREAVNAAAAVVCPAPAVHVSTPTVWVASVGAVCIVLLILCILCAVKWASCAARKAKGRP